jgi:hypothetical protein
MFLISWMGAASPLQKVQDAEIKRFSFRLLGAIILST